MNALVLLLASGSVALADDFVVDDPIRETIVRLQARVGVPITYETGPTDHLLQDVLRDGQPFVVRGKGVRSIPQRAFPIGTPTVSDRAAALEVLRTMVEARTSWDGWDGCTELAVTEDLLGFHVFPTRVVVDGDCVPYESPLDVRIGEGWSGGGPTHTSGRVLAEMLKPHGIGLIGGGVQARFPEDGSGLTLREALRQTQEATPTLSWEVLGTDGHYILKWHAVGANAEHLDPASYPFHREHVAKRQREELGLTLEEIETRHAETRREAYEASRRSIEANGIDPMPED